MMNNIISTSIILSNLSQSVDKGALIKIPLTQDLTILSFPDIQDYFQVEAKEHQYSITKVPNQNRDDVFNISIESSNLVLSFKQKFNFQGFLYALPNGNKHLKIVFNWLYLQNILNSHAFLDDNYSVIYSSIDPISINANLVSTFSLTIISLNKNETLKHDGFIKIPVDSPCIMIPHWESKNRSNIHFEIWDIPQHSTTSDLSINSTRSVIACISGAILISIFLISLIVYPLSQKLSTVRKEKKLFKEFQLKMNLNSQMPNSPLITNETSEYTNEKDISFSPIVNQDDTNQ